MARSHLSRRANLLAPSAIVYLSQLAQKCNAINLAEGYPDFPAPQPFKDAAISAISADFNQYRHVQGVCDKVAEAFELAQGVKVNPQTQVTICCGQSEALVASILAVVDEEDEVILLDPSYETYEVYEHIQFTGTKHRSIASFPGMLERTIVTSSISKTFSVTGWRIGWAIASELISSAISKIHGKLTDSAPAPFQEAAVSALGSASEYYTTLRKEYVKRRDFVCEMLEEAGFNIQFKPEGSFFVFAQLPATSLLGDVEYVAELIQTAGVAIVPGCVFFHADDTAHEAYRSQYVRVAFCKDIDTLSAAREAFRGHCKL